MTNFLIADIGGTNMRIALSTPEGILNVKPYKCANYPGGPAEIIAAYCAYYKIEQPEQAVFAVAGPVGNSSIFKFTNGAWSETPIDFGQLGMNTVLINDFAAQAYALLELKRENFRPILTIPGHEPFYPSDIKGNNAGNIIINPATTLVIEGSGTGWGVAKAFALRNQFIVASTEAGHALPAFKPEDQNLINKIRKLNPDLKHISYETFCSGGSIGLIFEAISGYKAKPQEIDLLALQRNKNALKAHEFFAKMLARSSAANVLTANARTLVLAGDVTKILLQKGIFNVPVFRDEFQAANTLGANNFLPKVPVIFADAQDTGVLGAHAFAQYCLN